MIEPDGDRKLEDQKAEDQELEDQEFVALVAEEDLWDGEMEAFDVDGREIIVLRVDGEVRAFDGSCPHQSLPLAEGVLDGHTLTCWGHEWQFDVRTGRGINPRTAHLARHDVKIMNGMIHVSRRAHRAASASRL